MKYIILLSVLISLTGCATTSDSGLDSADGARMLDVAMVLKFEDVPIPSGFKPVAKDSFVFENDVLRVGILKYAGKAKAHQVVDFYKDQMPLYNWRFLNMMEYGRRIMNFDRDDQSCIIVVEPGRMSTSVSITVSPKAGRASTYKAVRRED